MKYSTRQAAKKLGISFPTLNRYIADQKIPLPPVVKVGDVKVRLWSDREIEQVRALLPKIANGRKTRYQKQSKTQETQTTKQAGRKPKP